MSLFSCKSLFRPAALAVLFAFCALPAFAFDVSVKANVDNAQVFVGDMFNYEIQVTAPENAIVDLPSFVGNLGSFEVKEMKNEKVTEGMPKGTAKFVWLATLNTFVSGDFLIAPQQVNAVVGNDTVKVNTDPVAVKVSTGQGACDDRQRDCACAPRRGCIYRREDQFPDGQGDHRQACAGVLRGREDRPDRSTIPSGFYPFDNDIKAMYNAINPDKKYSVGAIDFNFERRNPYEGF